MSTVLSRGDETLPRPDTADNRMAQTVSTSKVPLVPATTGLNEKALPPVEKAKVTPTPLPRRELLALTLMMMNEHVGSTMLLPFLGFYVAHLTGQTKEAAGYTSGFLISMFMIGQFCCGKAWGRLSDTYGRKPILLSGVFCSAVAVVLFGLSRSLWMALVTRLLHGLMNGNVAIGKVVVTEITDKTNESKGFVVISLSWALGALLGPFIGGFLYDPVHSGKLDWLGLDPDGVFATHPALLPSIGASFYSVLAAVCGLVFLPETNAKARSISCFLRDGDSSPSLAAPSKDAKPLTAGQPTHVVLNPSPDLLPHVILNPRKRQFHTAEHQIHRVDECCIMAPVPNVAASKVYEPADVCSPTTASSGLMSPDRAWPTSTSEDDFSSVSSPSAQSSVFLTESPLSRKQTAASAVDTTAAAAAPSTTVEQKRPREHQQMASKEKKEEKKKKKESYGFRQVFSDPATRTATLMYVVLCGADYGIGEIFPLWAICSVETGGLALQAPDIGLIVVACGITGVVALIVFPSLLAWFPHRMVLWQLSTLVTSISYVGVPYSSMAFSRTTAIVITVVMTSIRLTGLCWAFSTVFMFIAGVAPKEHLGAMNGVAQASGALLRAIVPIFATPLFALSVQYPIPPVFGYYTTFILCAALLWWGYYLSVGFVVPEREPEPQPTAPREDETSEITQVA